MLWIYFLILNRDAIVQSLETDGQPMPVSSDMKPLSMAMSLTASMDELPREREEGVPREGTGEVLDHADIQLNLGEIFTEGVSGGSACLLCWRGCMGMGIAEDNNIENGRCDMLILY